jgi:hypothetical protein
MIGSVYLLHLDPGVPRGGGVMSRHYIGWALNVQQRLAEHQRGAGSPLVAAAINNGSTVTLARTWTGVDRNYERQLKNQKQAPRLCPVCNGARALTRAGETALHA